MSISMYNLTVPVLVHGLGVLSDYLDKMAAHCAEKAIDPKVLIEARLAPDMLTFAGQVQRASDNAKGALARLAGVQAPSFPDTETTLPQLRERIAKTIDFLKSIEPAQLEGSENRPIDLKFPNVTGPVRGETYLLSLLLPNFYFHIATAHAILRHNGVQIGKVDYIGRIA